MKQIIYIFALVFGLWSCNGKTTEKTSSQNSNDTVKTVLEKKEQHALYIKDKSKYDKSFLEGLSGYKGQLKLIDDFILIDQDTVYFPEDILLNKETIFKGIKDFKNFVLTVTRTNLTSLNYNFQLFDKDKNLIISKIGKASLGSTFFLGSEADEDDDETEEGYLSSEYYDNSSDCTFAIRIGEKDSKGKSRAKIKLYCKNNKSKSIGLSDSPTLRTE
jgi:hypothetical protein